MELFRSKRATIDKKTTAKREKTKQQDAPVNVKIYSTAIKSYEYNSYVQS